MGDLDPQLDQFLRKQPSLGEGVYLASTAVVVGDVRIGDYSSVWYHAVLRGDINYIRVGAYTNIQDGAVVHLACLLYTSPSPRDATLSRMPSSA